MDTLLMGALLLVIMLILLAGGVWIAMTLAIVGWVGQAFFTSTLPGKNRPTLLKISSSGFSITLTRPPTA